MENDVRYKVDAGFFDAIDEDRTYSAEDMNRPYRKLISNGVFATPAGTPSDFLQVFTANNGMNVIVSAGCALIGDKWFENPSDLMITISQNSEILPRIDSIVAQVDKTQAGRMGSIVYRQGQASSNPIHPNINTEEDIPEFRLADIRISPSCVEITQNLITDCRGSDECPWITSLIYQVDTSTLYAQWQAAYKKYYEDQEAEHDEYFEKFKNTMASFFAQEEQSFETWFNQMKDQLSEDAAGNLLNFINIKIEDMSKRYTRTSMTAITTQGFGKIRRLYGNTVQKNNKTQCVGDDINILNINVNESVLGMKVSTDNNVVTISGNSTEDGFFVLWKGILKKGTYHVRAFDTAGATTTTILRIRRGTDVITTGHMFSFTLQQDTEIFVDLWFNSEFNGTYKYAPKMVKDNPVTIWSPYKYGTVEIISKKEEVESRNITYVKSPLCCIKNEEGQIIAQDILDYENKKIIRQCKYEIINGEPAITQLPEIIEEKLQCSDKIEQYDNKTTIYCRDEAVIELTLSDNKAISEINSNMKNIEDNMVLNIEEEKENITNKAFNGKQIYKYMIPIEQAQINSNANLIISHNIEDLKIDKLLQLSGIIKTKVSKYWYTVPSNYNTTPITLRLLDTQLQLIIPKEMSAEQFVEKGYITLLYTKNE